jgi:AraC-like DNA-binding protein
MRFPSIHHVGHLDKVRWTMPAHHHDDVHQLIVVLEGEIEVQMHKQRIFGGPGHVLFYPRTVEHEERSVGDERLVTLFLSWTEGDFDISLLPLRILDRTGRIQMLIRWIAELFPVHTPLQRHTLDALLHECARPPGDSGHENLQRARRHVQEHLREPLTLDDLAAVAGMSRFHFARAFRRLYGVSPMRFVAQARVEAARTILLTTAPPLREVAARVGFADEFQLSRVFKRITGYAPGAVRQRRLK